MIEFLLVAIFCSASLSLVSYIYCWHDIRNGRPHILSLRQITSIMDRNRLNQLFGKPEPGYYYLLTPDQLYGITQQCRWFYTCECAADITCIAGVWLYMTGTIGNANILLFTLLAGLCQMINLAYSIRLIRKWHGQLREEIENSED